MTKVVGVKFKKAGKMYYFDPAGYKLKNGDNVIVETSRGQEFGTVTMKNREISKDELVSPLKKIMRVATEKDMEKNQENLKKCESAMARCQEKIEKHSLEMKLIDVEYTFDNSKVIFYFTADGRVDFRELVKDLASVFHTRIELRQIGVRDEAKMLGGIGHCGKDLCCATWLPDFEPVSIKMAKAQNMSLNPTKISGICGRLMCCLKYENDLYMELKKGMPETGEKIETPEGRAVVLDTNILESKIRARLILDNDEKDENSDEFSNDIYTFEKSEIRHLRGKGRRGRHKNKEEFEDISEEMKDLLKD